MRGFSRILLGFACVACLVPRLRAEVAAQSGASAIQAIPNASAIRAIRQAPDPSGVVAAYADAVNGSATDPRLLDAYVNRMVELGVPEMAFHQAQTLTAMQPENGLGWGVIAYVDGHRGNMADAITALVKAGHYAPENQFVQQTAGGVVAWYDASPNKSSLPEEVQQDLDAIRQTLGTRAGFVTAYNNAKQAQPAVGQMPGQPPSTVAPSASEEPAYSQDYYSGSYAYAPPYDDSGSYAYAAPYDYYGAGYGYPYGYYPYGYYGASWVGGWPWWGPFYGGAFIGTTFVFSNSHHHHDADHNHFVFSSHHAFASHGFGFSHPGFNSFAGHSFAGHSFAGQPFVGHSFAGHSFAGQPFVGHSFAGHSFPQSAPPAAFGGHAVGGGGFHGMGGMAHGGGGSNHGGGGGHR